MIEDNGNQLILPDEVIISKIYLVRGKKVMLDKDLAELYEVKALRLRQQVKRNMERFPENFMFRLTQEETDFMVSQNAIPSRQYLGGHLPLVFTEHRVLMLANVLKSERAIKMSIRIIEVFLKIREMLLTHNDILLKLEKLEQKVVGHDDNIIVIFEYLRQLEQTRQQEVLENLTTISEAVWFPAGIFKISNCQKLVNKESETRKKLGCYIEMN